VAGLVASVSEAYARLAPLLERELQTLADGSAEPAELARALGDWFEWGRVNVPAEVEQGPVLTASDPIPESVTSSEAAPPAKAHDITGP